MTLIQLLKFKNWETRLFKMPCLVQAHQAQKHRFPAEDLPLFGQRYAVQIFARFEIKTKLQGWVSKLSRTGRRLR